jgi:Ser/Thr protein kinase RdoA (MazF antagonist)
VIEALEPVLGPPVELEVLKHKEGRRTTYWARGARRKAVVKVYVSERAPTVAARTRALTGLVPEVEVPEVLLCEPALHLVALSEVPGVPLRHAVLAGDLQTCSRAGAALGAWHRAGQGTAPGALSRHTTERELEILEARLENAPPEIAAPVRAALPAVADGTWDWPGVVHRDLYEEQILVGERIGLIDLDDAALGPPELDIGNLLGHLDLLGIRSEQDLTAVTESLLEAYGRTGPKLDERLLERCRCLTLLRLACIHEDAELVGLVPSLARGS